MIIKFPLPKDIIHDLFCYNFFKKVKFEINKGFLSLVENAEDPSDISKIMILITSVKVTFAITVFAIQCILRFVFTVISCVFAPVYIDSYIEKILGTSVVAWSARYIIYCVYMYGVFTIIHCAILFTKSTNEYTKG